MGLLNVSIKKLISNNFYLNEDKVKSVKRAYANNKHEVLPPIVVVCIDSLGIVSPSH